MDIFSITVDQIKAVYSGKRDTCACGCAGTHTESRASAKRILAKVQANAKNAGVLDPLDPENEGPIVSVDVGERMYILYLNKPS